MCRLYGNTKLLYIRGLSRLRFWYPWQVLQKNPLQIPSDNVFDFMEEDPEQLMFSFVKKDEDLQGLH